MNNKGIKRWLNVGRLCAEYKQVIQKSRIECLQGIVYIGCKRECKAVFFKFVGIVSQSLDETKAVSPSYIQKMNSTRPGAEVIMESFLQSLIR